MYLIEYDDENEGGALSTNNTAGMIGTYLTSEVVSAEAKPNDTATEIYVHPVPSIFVGGCQLPTDLPVNPVRCIVQGAQSCSIPIRGPLVVYSFRHFVDMFTTIFTALSTQIRRALSSVQRTNKRHLIHCKKQKTSRRWRQWALQWKTWPQLRVLRQGLFHHLVYFGRFVPSL